MNIEIQELLSEKFPFLYEPELKDAISEIGSIQKIPQGETIIDIGQYIKSVPLLVEGSIKIVREDSDMNEILLYYLERGETCAMSLTCCMTDAQSEIRAIAMENTTIIRIPVEKMDAWMNDFVSWKGFVMQAYRYRFEELLQTIDSIAFMKMDERLEKYLLERSAQTNSRILLGTHGEIAQDLNTSREVVSRLLKQLEKLGRVKLSRNKIEII